MNEAKFTKSINSSFQLYTDLGLARSFQVPASLSVNLEFNRLALNTITPYPDLFFSGLKLNQFNFILKDLSYFQFSRNMNDVRYAFYPSPFDPKMLKVLDELTNALDSNTLEDEAYNVCIESLPSNYCRPVIRYDYSPDQYKPVKHPTAHFHIGTFGEDRWCVERLLTPYAFALQMAKMYFGEYWEALTEEDDNERRSNEFDRLLNEERSACKITPIEKFSSIDQSHFYFS